MAGAYPDVPTRRMAWDADGTVVLYLAIEADCTPAYQSPPSPFGVQMVLADKQKLNDDNALTGLSLSPGTGDDGTQWVNMLFPELRDILGYYCAGSVSGGVSTANRMRTSADTTNGIDGAITAFDSETSRNTTINEDARNFIIPASELAKRNFQWQLCNNSAGANSGSSVMYAIHLYGEIAAGETPHRIVYIDEATGLEFGATGAPEVIDFGDTPRGSARDYTFRLKNISGTETATTIDIAAEALDGDPSAAWLTFDEGGGGFSTTEQVASLAPGASSALLTVRQHIPDGGDPRLHTARIKADVNGGWA